ncbi:MAG: hypothetical protein QGH52_05965, partial [Prochlorococcaceae cyanobacterium ETNP1_MAG_8]|nr:hypothetical protein [Prochlorococcaceae cyanobacterium ETNP1_MAG_8]
AWPSGKAEDCKSFIPSSNLGAAFDNVLQTSCSNWRVLVLVLCKSGRGAEGELGYFSTNVVTIPLT